MLKAIETTALVAALIFAACLFVLMFFYASPSAAAESPQQQHSEKHEPKKYNGETDKSIWEKARTDPVAFFTLWLVIFTAVLSGVSVIQLKLLTRAETVAERSANAAKNAAEAAKQSVAAYAAAERATIIVRPLSPERVPGQSDGQNLWRVGMQFVNIGNTAPRQVAIRLLIGGKAAIKIPSGATKAPKSPDWDASLINSHPGLVADIGPHESTRLWTNAFAESGLMGDDNSRTFFYGTVIYDDVFKTTHRREFCLTTFRAPGQAVPGVYYCDLHNCEDEQCDQ